MSWHVARSLQSFIGQCDAAWPNRSKSADGTIGDTRHQQETSGHNPDATGAVAAFDLTHDPTDGPDCNVVSVQLADSGDKRLSQGYLIWNRRIWFPGKGWQPYHGSDPHTGHLHFSVGHDTYPYKGSHGDSRLYDDPSAWQLPVFGDDDMADVMVPTSDNNPHHKPGTHIPLPEYLDELSHEIFAIREIVTQIVHTLAAKK